MEDAVRGASNTYYMIIVKLL